MIDPICPDFSDTPVSDSRPCYAYTLSQETIPQITIITPFYNAGPVFHETAASVFGQSFQAWEWLIINDGSTDPDSLALLEEYTGKDSRIRVVEHSQNRGLSAARNTGFKEANTPYVVQLDSDDLLEPLALEMWGWFLATHPDYAFVKGYSIGFGALEYLWHQGFHNGKLFLTENPVDATSMIRKSVHAEIAGYDETARGGLEDWDFWLKSANAGFWGTTIPHYLNWYRRRENHGDRWANWDGGARMKAFLENARKKYPKLWSEFPEIYPKKRLIHNRLPEELPFENPIAKEKPRLLMVIPWLTIGGVDKYNLDLLEQLTKLGWEVTIATTLKGDHSWLPLFGKHTPDIFPMADFLHPHDQPLFLRYLVESRQIDVVMVSHSELGYRLLPYLRSHCPRTKFVDVCHIEDEAWNGGYPGTSVDFQENLDLHIAVSEHLKQWMVARGAEPEKVQVCTINVNPDNWMPEPSDRCKVREEFQLGSDTSLILYPARICAQKQPMVFAKSLKLLAQSNPNFLAVVAGNGPDEGALKEELTRLGISDKVRLLGGVPNQRIRMLMAGADILFLPSQWEGIALVLFEAMAAGLPIVGADVGGQKELVTPDCGILIARSDEESEAVHYAKLLAELIADPIRCKKMGNAGQQRIRQSFRLDQMGSRMDSLFKGTLAHPDFKRPSRNLGNLYAARVVENIIMYDEMEQVWAEFQRIKQNPLEQFIPWKMLASLTIKRFPGSLKGKLKRIIKSLT